MDERLLTAAGTAATTAAERAGVTIRELRDIDEHAAAGRLFDAVWGRRDPAVPTELIRALAHAGNQVSGAFDGDELVAATVAFLGRHADGRLHLHSHITGALGPAKGVGFALKQHQRAWCLEREIAEVTWTFDPLIRRNAYFNLVKLGAHLVSYHRDFYGTMDDDLNRGQATDRGEISWRLDDPRAIRAADGHGAEPRVDALRQTGAEVVLDIGDGGAPALSPSDAARLLARVPEDIEAMRAQDADLASRWRMALRDVLGSALDEGYRVAGFTRDGWYLLTRGQVEELRR